MSSVGPEFAAAVNCIDGRTQVLLMKWIKKRYGVNYVDMITEPGVDKILAEKANPHTIESIRRKVEMSVTKHGSKPIAIAGHHDCAGNPVDQETHLAQITTAVMTIVSRGFR